MAKIGIIGAGFSGLGAAYYMPGHKITLFESAPQVGGLASGIRTPEWEWPVDKVIHHWFTTDKWALDIAKEIGLSKKLIIKDTKSSCYYNGKIAELDSPVSLLRFPFIQPWNRIRLGTIMAKMRFDKGYLNYEKETSFDFIKRTMGPEVFRVLWEPLFAGKFGKHAPNVNAAWFWARIHPRTKSLAYVEGGFQNFAEKMVEVLEQRGNKILTGQNVSRVAKKADKFEVISNGKKHNFDAVIMAVPLQVALKLYDFDKSYAEKYAPLKSIGAQYFVLELKEKFMKDGSYWLNVNDKNMPFMMVAEHTNFVDKKHYNNNHIIWVGKYLDYDDPLWNLSEEELLKKIIPCLKQINPEFDEKQIVRSFFTRFPNAQPILPLNYSSKIPTLETPVKNLFLANMNQIYPWDRGTNNALGLGNKIAQILNRRFSF